MQTLEIKNFREIKNFSLPTSSSILIKGNNGSGKTSIIWSFIFFLEGYHLNRNIYIHSKFTEWLPHPEDNDISDEPAEFMGKFDEFVAIIKLQSNYVLRIYRIFEEKICFAVLKDKYDFCRAKDEVACLDMYSFMKNIRQLYFQLSDEQKYTMNVITQSMFGKYLDTRFKSGIVKVICNGKTEIQHQSTSFQKVFTILVYFFTLMNKDAIDHYLLIDNFDSHLSKETMSGLLKFLNEFNENGKVKFIFTVTEIGDGHGMKVLAI